MSIPSLERLRADLGQTYQLLDETGASLPVLLCDVRQGIAMNPSFVCYSAELCLPPGVALSQLSCTVAAGNERWEHLLLTPVGVDAAGQQRMQMVFHCQGGADSGSQSAH